ncbi:hypothetical protein ES705_50097 [subsurface metagenome]
MRYIEGTIYAWKFSSFLSLVDSIFEVIVTDNHHHGFWINTHAYMRPEIGQSRDCPNVFTFATLNNNRIALANVRNFNLF